MNKAVGRVFLAVLLLALAAQLVLLAQVHAARFGEIYRAIGQPGAWRSANFAFGQRAADYFRFLNATVPGDAVVLIPVQARTPDVLLTESYVEFFLWPRVVRFCEDTPAACIQQAGKLNQAVLISDLQSVPSAPDWGDRFQTFDDDWAVYLPVSPSSATPWQPFASLAQFAFTGLPALLLLIALVLPGVLVARRTLPGEQLLLHVALGIGSGIAAFTLSLYALLVIGIALGAAMILGALTLLWVTSALLLCGRKPAKHLSKLSRQDWLILGVLLIPVAASFLLSIGNGYTTTDEFVLWGAKGYGIPAVGLQIGATERGTLTTWYPLNIPLIISSFRVLFAERLPESKLVFPLFLLGSVGLAYTFLRRRTAAWPAALGALLLATTPVMFSMSTMAHGNLPFAFYLGGAAVLLTFAQQGKPALSNAYWIWGVLFLTFAAWTRPEGLHLAWAVALATVVIQRRDLAKQTTKLIGLLGGLGLYTLFWALTSPLVYYQAGFTDSAFSTAFGELLRGNFHFQEAGFILATFLKKFLLETEWGSMAWIVLLCTVLVFGSSQRKNRDLTILGCGLVILLAVYAAFLANTYTFYPQLDIGNWMNTSFMRLVLPGLLLVWLGLLAAATSVYFPSKDERSYAKHTKRTY